MLLPMCYHLWNNLWASRYSRTGTTVRGKRISSLVGWVRNDCLGIPGQYLRSKSLPFDKIFDNSSNAFSINQGFDFIFLILWIRLSKSVVKNITGENIGTLSVGTYEIDFLQIQRWDFLQLFLLLMRVPMSLFWSLVTIWPNNDQLHQFACYPGWQQWHPDQHEIENWPVSVWFLF